MIGAMPGIDVHWGLAVGVVACVVSLVLIEQTTLGFRRPHRRRQRRAPRRCKACRSAR